MSVRHRYKRVKLPQCTHFYAGITICMIHVPTAQINLHNDSLVGNNEKQFSSFDDRAERILNDNERLNA